MWLEFKGGNYRLVYLVLIAHFLEQELKNGLTSAIFCQYPPRAGEPSSPRVRWVFGRFHRWLSSAHNPPRA